MKTGSHARLDVSLGAHRISHYTCLPEIGFYTLKCSHSVLGGIFVWFGFFGQVTWHVISLFPGQGLSLHAPYTPYSGGVVSSSWTARGSLSEEVSNLS